MSGELSPELAQALDAWLDDPTAPPPPFRRAHVPLAPEGAEDESAELERALEPFPYARPEGSDANMFIQWKGTDACLDFYCPCGAHGHFDGFFASYLRCHACGAVYQMGTQVIARRVGPSDDVPPAMIRDLESDNDEQGA